MSLKDEYKDYHSNGWKSLIELAIIAGLILLIIFL